MTSYKERRDEILDKIYGGYPFDFLVQQEEAAQALDSLFLDLVEEIVGEDKLLLSTTPNKRFVAVENQLKERQRARAKELLGRK